MPIFDLTFLSSLLFSKDKSEPSTKTLPVDGDSNLFTMRKSVDFPAPERPIIPKISPFSI